MSHVGEFSREILSVGHVYGQLAFPQISSLLPPHPRLHALCFELLQTCRAVSHSSARTFGIGGLTASPDLLGTETFLS